MEFNNLRTDGSNVIIEFTGYYKGRKKPITITFVPGITTLIGKNGSGKN